jgi:hypothetical protein
VFCDLITTQWEDPAKHLATDLSPHGCWIDTSFPLPPGTDLVVAFTPPRWHGGEVVTFARVTRRVRTGTRRGMGLEFLDVSPSDVERMSRTLRGLPPPLTTARRRPKEELVWVDALLTWQEDLGDRINTFAVSEMIGLIDDDELEAVALAPPLGGVVAA